MTADRGYGKLAFLDAMTDSGVSSLFVMPDNVIASHPFVSSSHLDAGRDDLDESMRDGEQVVENEDTGDDTNPFVVEDGGRLGSESRSARFESRERNSSRWAFCVREPSRKGLAKLVRFIADMPSTTVSYTHLTLPTKA